MSRRRRPRSTGSHHLPWDRLYPTLDLHGTTAEEARRRTERWLRGQQAAGEPMVRVITGKGMHSVGPPVLRAEIEALLDSLRGRSVARYEMEPGGGVFRIEVRREKRARGPAAPRTPPGRTAFPAANELRRRAEEALWELGITPTRELIDAEIRRIQREEAKGR